MNATATTLDRTTIRRGRSRSLEVQIIHEAYRALKNRLDTVKEAGKISQEAYEMVLQELYKVYQERLAEIYFSKRLNAFVTRVNSNICYSLSSVINPEHEHSHRSLKHKFSNLTVLEHGK